jgi:membrane-bound transcription factor site-1 protease
MVIDPEDYFSEHEIIKVRQDIEYRGLSLIVIADWYN